MNEQDWFDVEGSKLGAAVVGAITEAQRDNTQRETDQLTFLRLYDGRRIRGLRGKELVSRGPSAIKRDPISCNLVRRITDAARNRIGKAVPAVRVLTTRADWDTQQHAKELGRLVEGAFYSGEVPRKSLVALTLGILLGDSAIKVIEDGAKVRFEWVYPFELIVPENDQLYGEPRELFQVKWVSRHRLAKRFPDEKQAIGKLDKLVEVWEAWKLPDGEEAPGRHVIVTKSGLVLADEKWEHERFPFAWFHVAPEPGFWSTGLGAILLPFQFELNLLLRTVQANVRAASNVKVIVEKGSTNLNHLTNQPGIVIEVAPGTTIPPQWLATPAISADLVRQIEFTISQAWEECGFSQTAGAAMKPANLSSGLALLTYADQQTERQALLGKAWEAMFAELATLTIEAAQRIYEREGEFVATWPGKTRGEMATMDRAMLDKDAFQVRVYSASRLPETLSGRLQLLTELVETGLFTDRQVILKLLDFPDIEAELENETAPVNLAEQLVSRILSGQPPVAPSEFLDLQTLLRKASLAYVKAQLNEAPVDVLDALTTLITQTQDLLASASASGEPAPMPAPDEGAELPPDPMSAVA
jgi:hypothetical protein